MSLVELFKQKNYPTDKGTDHSYLETYDELFKPFKEAHINILELGVWKGGSIQLWTDFFTNAKIIGYDVTIYDGDVFPKTAIRVLKNVNNISPTEFETTPLTIAIDDGSHSLEDQLTFIKTIYPQLLSGGILIIEDVQNIDNQKKEFDSLNIPYEVIDLRGVKNRYDDVLLIFRK